MNDRLGVYLTVGSRSVVLVESVAMENTEISREVELMMILVEFQ